MVGPVNNSTQQAFVNPFQQRQETAVNGQNKKPEENRTQPREAAAAGTQFTDTGNAKSRETTQSVTSFSNREAATGNRGRLFDVTV